MKITGLAITNKELITIKSQRKNRVGNGRLLEGTSKPIAAGWLASSVFFGSSIPWIIQTYARGSRYRGGQIK